MTLLVIDGNSIINRAFYGIRLLSNKKGVFTNAVTGFFNIYIKLITKFNPDFVAVAFDLKAPTFRHLKYDGYKATRKGMPDELAMQLPYVKEILSAMGVSVVEKEGFEADDILGTLAKAAEMSGHKCIIATGDRDSFQLITDNISVNLAANKEEITYTPAIIQEAYGVSPLQMLEVKALMGDSSDNIPGVAGIGEKTAFSLIIKYQSIDNIYEHISELEVTKSVKEKLEKGKEMCYLSKFLGTISLDVPVVTNLETYRIGTPHEQKLADILAELEMFSLLKKLNVKAVPNVVHAEEKEEHSPQKAFIEPLSEDDTDVFLDNGKVYICSKNICKELDFESQKEFFSGIVQKRTFNLKELYSYCFKNDFELKNVVFDSTLAAYLLNVNASEYTLERLCLEYGLEYSPEADKLAEILHKLSSILYFRICESDMLNVLREIEMPLSEVLVSMEKNGISLDSAGVSMFGDKLSSDIENITSEIYSLAGTEFNISSPKQLGEVLFERLKLPFGKKTKTGYSTNAEVLETLLDKHEIVPLIMEYRTLTKLYSTYVQGLLKVVGEDGRIHTTFKQTETRTGRISSVEPNIQNIPIRTERGKEMRKFFIAKEGYKLVDADYSQIELRVLAAISDDKIMEEAFENGDDIHAITASQVFNQPLEWVTGEMRSSAKAVNFGIVYGIGAFSLSKDIGVTVSEADRYIKSYLSKYEGVKNYMDRTVTNAEKNGFVTTLYGRKRFVPEINAKNKIVQALGKRIAMNTPVQGTAADIIKIAMVRVYNRLKAENIEARLILQVHDELIVEAKDEFAGQAAEILREEMQNAVELKVPLVVEVNVGGNWCDAH